MSEDARYKGLFQQYLDASQDITWKTSWPERRDKLAPHAETLLSSLADNDLLELVQYLVAQYGAGEGEWNKNSEQWAWNIWQLYNAHITAEAMRIKSHGFLKRKFPYSPPVT